MSIFKAQKELQKQFERQVGAGQYLDRFEDATLSRGRLIAGQRLLPHGVILSKDLKAKAAKKKRKVKRTSKGLKGEVARIKKQQNQHTRSLYNLMHLHPFCLLHFALSFSTFFFIYIKFI